MAVWLTACGGGVQDSITPPPPPADTTRTPVVQRATLTVQVAIEAADTSVARVAGVGADNVSVTLVRVGGGEAARTAVSRQDGTAVFRDLLEGQYQVTVTRELSANERARLPIEEREVSLFAGGGTAIVTPPADRATRIELVASRRGSLVFSEVYRWIPIIGTTSYQNAQYTELTNVADTTIFLDGMLIVRTFGQQHGGTPESGFCDTYREMRMDTTALWVIRLYRFPGSGREYPIRPGQSIVWALDAIDHGALVPGAPDLSRAQFEEIGGPADVDNPSAAKMLPLTRGSDVVPNGYPMVDGNLTALVLPIARDTNDLERRSVPLNNPTAWRIPRASVLDVMSIATTPERYTGTASYRSGFRYCEPWMNGGFERALAQLWEPRDNKAMRRRLLGISPSNVPILQRTRTSARDFEVAEPLRRSLNR
jgi:hypothetical protein